MLPAPRRGITATHRPLHAVIRWVRSCWKQNAGVSSVSFAQNKQGQGFRKDLMACYALRFETARSTEGKIGGIAMYITAVFYLQMCGVVLPRSVSLGVRGGLLQAFGLSLRRSVTCSSRRCVQGNRQAPSGYNS